MKRSLVFTALFLCASLASCQCADPPDVGPVEGGDEQARRVQDVAGGGAARRA